MTRWSYSEINHAVISVLTELKFTTASRTANGEGNVGATHLTRGFPGFKIVRVVTTSGALETLASFANAAEVMTWCEGAEFALRKRQ